MCGFVSLLFHIWFIWNIFGWSNETGLQIDCFLDKYAVTSKLLNNPCSPHWTETSPLLNTEVHIWIPSELDKAKPHTYNLGLNKDSQPKFTPARPQQTLSQIHAEAKIRSSYNSKGQTLCPKRKLSHCIWSRAALKFKGTYTVKEWIIFMGHDIYFISRKKAYCTLPSVLVSLGFSKSFYYLHCIKQYKLHRDLWAREKQFISINNRNFSYELFLFPHNNESIRDPTTLPCYRQGMSKVGL